MDKKTRAPRFKLGDKVTWESGAGYGWKQKTGEVIAVIRDGQNPSGRIHRECARRNARTAWGGGRKRDHQSYLVLVPSDRPTGKPTIYWPRVSALHPA